MHNSGPEADANQVRPGGRFGFGLVTGHPIGLLVVAAVLIVVLYGVPPARLFFLGAVVLGGICGFVLWLRHR